MIHKLEDEPRPWRGKGCGPRRGTAPMLLAISLTIMPATTRAQQPAPAEPEGAGAVHGVDSLVALALEVNPTIHMALNRAEAARARIAPAGAWPDPVLSAGIMNLPLSEPGFGDFMTMSTIGVGQRVPYPGKLSLSERAAELELRAAVARVEAARWDVAAELRKAYYDLAFLDRSLEVIERSQDLLVNLIKVTESRYGVGTGGQQDVLKARVEAARLAEEAVALTEARRARLARLNAMLARPSTTPVAEPRVPDRLARMAVPDDPSRIRFTTDDLGARAADSPLPPLEVLQARAVRSSPLVTAHEAEIAAQAARLELSRKAHLPDFDISVQYGQRVDRADMVSIMVSAPLPIHRSSRQDERVAEARAELSAMQAGHHEMVHRLNADLADAYAAVERARARIALFVGSIIPQGRAALESATLAFQVDRADFLMVLENERTLYNYRTAYFRALADFAKGVAELERLVGAEVLP